jgi:hypothetical protein
VGKEDEYRANAAAMVKMAAKLPTAADKGRLLRMAEEWLDLADRSQKRAGSAGPVLPEHPLLREKLGPDQTDAGQTDAG